jgi:hypothetical protein
VKRNAKQVVSKIQHLEQQFCRVCDSVHTKTSVGIQEEDKGELEDLVKKRCKYYYDLEDIMGDCSSAGPKLTSDVKLFFDSESEEENEKNNTTVAGLKRDYDDDDDDDYVDNNDKEDDNVRSDNCTNGFTTPMIPKRLEKQKITTKTTITKSTKKQNSSESKSRRFSVILYDRTYKMTCAKINKLNVSFPADHAHERR